MLYNSPMITQTRFLSRKVAESLKPAVGTSLISITSPDAQLGQPVHGPQWSEVLYLQFHDIDYVDEGEKLILFDNALALKVIDFIEKRAELDRALFVHCEGGVSRSAAVSKFIAEMFRLDFSHSYQLYNKHVYRTLYRTFHGTSRSKFSLLE